MNNRIPRFLYRYEKFEDKRIETLERRKLWFSSPEKFNDPFDTRLILDSLVSKPWSCKKILEVMGIIYSGDCDESVKFFRASKTFELIKEFLQEDNNDLRQELRAAMASIVARGWLPQTVKACCFFEAGPSDRLMWAHYGEKHQGFCVQYETQVDQVSQEDQVLAMFYSSGYPKVGLTEILFSLKETIQRVVTCKHIDWRHEQEHRIIKWNINQSDADGEMPIPGCLIPKRIIMGCKFPDNKEQEIYKAARALNCDSTRVECIENQLCVANLNDFKI